LRYISLLHFYQSFFSQFCQRAHHAFGKGRLLRNDLKETGTLGFTEVGSGNAVDDYQISVATNVLDYDNDGRLDIIIGNVMQRYLPGYDRTVPYNIFKLPQPEYQGDRRMFNVMHRSWHDANNADENLLLKLKHLLWDPLDPWLFYSMLAVYLMSMFLLYSADGQDIGRLESKTIFSKKTDWNNCRQRGRDKEGQVGI